MLLATEEIDVLKSEFDLLNQEPVVATRERVAESSRSLNTSSATTTTGIDSWAIGQFAQILEKKDHTIEEKNQLIFLLQRKIGEVETQMQQMLALPEVSEQKDQLKSKIFDLELSKQKLQQQVKKEKQWNAFSIAAAIIFACGLVLLLLS